MRNLSPDRIERGMGGGSRYSALSMPFSASQFENASGILFSIRKNVTKFGAFRLAGKILLNATQYCCHVADRADGGLSNIFDAINGSNYYLFAYFRVASLTMFLGDS